MVRLATGNVKQGTINAHILNKLVSASTEYRKRPRSSLDYQKPPGQGNENLVYPPIMQPPAPVKPDSQQRTTTSRRGTGIPPPSASRYEGMTQEGENPWSIGYMASGGFLAPAFAGDAVATWAPPDDTSSTAQHGQTTPQCLCQKYRNFSIYPKVATDMQSRWSS